MEAQVIIPWEHTICGLLVFMLGLKMLKKQLSSRKLMASLREALSNVTLKLFLSLANIADICPSNKPFFNKFEIEWNICVESRKVMSCYRKML